MRPWAVFDALIFGSKGSLSSLRSRNLCPEHSMLPSFGPQSPFWEVHRCLHRLLLGGKASVEFPLEFPSNFPGFPEFPGILSGISLDILPGFPKFPGIVFGFLEFPRVFAFSRCSPGFPGFFRMFPGFPGCFRVLPQARVTSSGSQSPPPASGRRLRRRSCC